jgi:hypothetical protein
MRVARLAVVASRVSGVAVIAVIAAVLCSLTSLASAQVTTANVRGTVKSADDGVPMAEVEVTLVDESTGSVKTVATNSDGSFAFTNLQIGGPYHVIATVAGFKSAEEKGIFLTANKTRDITLGLHLAEEVIEIAGTTVTRNTSNRTIVTAAEIEELPSVGRDPRDVVRRNPEASVEGRDRTLSLGGANTRYNSITVDGIRQDDDFGLNTSGYPTRRSPIALSAIQELTIDSAPFDVHFGKFLGGNVNIVTKSGTNEFKGTLVGTYSSDALLGNRSRDNRINVDYKEYRYGATVGGPIIKDKVHFLASVEGLSSTTPVDVGVAGSTAANTVSSVTQDDLSKVLAAARDPAKYNFDPGDPSRSLNEHDLKLLGKLDWNISKQHRATAIYQRTAGNSIQAATATATNLPLSSDWYDARDTLNTFAGRLFSDWSDQLSTEVEVNGKLVSSRVPPLNGNGFMSAQIKTQNPNVPTGNIFLGPDEFRHANLLDNDVFHTKAEANYLVGDHLVTGGAEFELLKIDNLFVRASNGVAVYNSVADFVNMKPASLRYNNSVTLTPSDAAANWSSGTTTGFLQDQVKLTNEVTVQGGVRFERYQTGDRITLNPNFVNRYGFENTSTLDGRSIFMPRLGISYLPTDHLNLRAGVGLFSGGTPSVWVSNNYTNDGVRTFTATCTNVPVTPNSNCTDPSVINGFNGRDIPAELKSAVMNGMGNGNVDVLDPNFKIPSVWKIGTGADYSFDIPGAGTAGKNVELKLNYTYTKVNHGVTWIDLRRNLDIAAFPNNTPIGQTVDGRPLYAPTFNTRRGYDMELTNDDRGRAHVASLQLQKGFPFGLFVSGAYAYTNNEEVNPGTSSISTSNYELAAVSNPQRPDLAASNYQRKHRFTAAVEYSHSLVSYLTGASPWKDMKTSVGMFIESRSGQPYSWSFSDANFGDNLARIFGEENEFAKRNRELFYVPKAPNADGTRDDVILNGITEGEFTAFLKKTGLAQYQGRIVPRNVFNSPWFTKIDMRLAQDLPNPLSGQRARFVVDIENLGNLLDHNWGRAQAVPFPFIAPAVDVNIDRATGKYIYSNLRSPNPTTVDVLQSVWRVSLGLMYDF